MRGLAVAQAHSEQPILKSEPLDATPWYSHNFIALLYRFSSKERLHAVGWIYEFGNVLIGINWTHFLYCSWLHGDTLMWVNFRVVLFAIVVFSGLYLNFAISKRLPNSSNNFKRLLLIFCIAPFIWALKLEWVTVWNAINHYYHTIITYLANGTRPSVGTQFEEGCFPHH